MAVFASSPAFLARRDYALGASGVAVAAVVAPLGFSDPTGAAITYTPLVAGSLGGLP